MSDERPGVTDAARGQILTCLSLCVSVQPEEEPDPEERDHFLQQLYKFMEDRGETGPVSPGPSGGCRVSQGPSEVPGWRSWLVYGGLGIMGPRAS